MESDELYMQRCLDLAKMGAGHVAPNPMVGAVIVYDEKIIGEGFHVRYGDHHAEVNAFASVADPSLLKESTIYVNLEPCSHYGKTPPCCDLIIEKKVKRVVVGCVDPYEEVSGAGIAAIRSAGIDVTVGVLEKECIELKRRFLTFQNKKRPYVILKWAQSPNDFIDIDRKRQDKSVFWITQKETKALTHKWRHEEAGILVGRNTVENDNPELTCRAMIGNSPARFVIDQNLKLNYSNYHLGDGSVDTYIITEKKETPTEKLQFLNPENFEIKGILRAIYKLNIQSLIVEGGKNTLERFIDSGLWDEARILTGTENITSGKKAPVIHGQVRKEFNFGRDRVKILRNE